MPRVSVIVPVYNAASFLRTCIDSLLNQRFDDYEIICVDDGSTDGSDAILKSYGDRIRTIHQSNQGQGAARNRGLAEATGDYIKFVDADDYLAPEALERLYTAATLSGADITVCRAHCIDAQGNLCRDLDMWNHLAGTFSREEYAQMDFFNHICSPVLWDKLIAAPLAHRNPSPHLRRGQDFVTLLQYLSEARLVHFIPDRLYFYRHHPDSVMAQPTSQETIIQDFLTEQAALKVIEKAFPDTPAYRYYWNRSQQDWSLRKNEILKLV